MRGQPEIVGTHLAAVLPLTQAGVGEGLAVGIHQLVTLELVVELDRVEKNPGMLSILSAALSTQLSPQVLTTRWRSGVLVRQASGISKMMALTFRPAWQSRP